MKSNAILRMREMRLIQLSKCRISDQNYIGIFFAPHLIPILYLFRYQNKHKISIFDTGSDYLNCQYRLLSIPAGQRKNIFLNQKPEM